MTEIKKVNSLEELRNLEVGDRVVSYEKNRDGKQEKVIMTYEGKENGDYVFLEKKLGEECLIRHFKSECWGDLEDWRDLFYENGEFHARSHLYELHTPIIKDYQERVKFIEESWRDFRDRSNEVKKIDNLDELKKGDIMEATLNGVKLSNKLLFYDFSPDYPSNGRRHSFIKQAEGEEKILEINVSQRYPLKKNKGVIEISEPEDNVFSDFINPSYDHPHYNHCKLLLKNNGLWEAQK